MDSTDNDQRRPQQEAEWREAQSILLSPDLISAAKRQLLFLAAVDKHRALYDDGPVLCRAIHRYKNCWLPLLAKQGQSGTATETATATTPLVVPLDCEWIWHCHRLNPVQYKKDCGLVFGEILDNRNVRSTTEEAPMEEMVELWGRLYPGEPFELDYMEDCVTNGNSGADSGVPLVVTFDYNLVAAVKRQSSFFYQVSRPTMHDRRFLEAAVTRYKGFLHLIRRNHEKSLKRFTVPTYDVDLIWHSHQLQPLSYCTDLRRLIGRVLEHDDTDSDRSKGKKLDVGFSETTKLWEETFGSRYWRAGAMYKGSSPSPVVTSPYKGAFNVCALPCPYQKQLPLSNTKFVEVFLEVVDVKNIPNHQRGTLFISFHKNSPDPFFSGDSSLDIQSETGKREIARFRCEPTGNIILTLGSKMASFFPVPKLAKIIGTISISVKDILEGESELAMEKWFELKVKLGNGIPKPIFLYVAASCTVPMPVPYVFYLAKLPTISRNTCFSPFPGKGQQLKHLPRFIDGNGSEIIKIFSRFSRNKSAEGSSTSKALLTSSIKQVAGFLRASGENHVLAEFVNDAWSFVESKFVLSLANNVSEDGHIFELRGEHLMKLFPGRRLEFEVRSCGCMKQKDERDFITVVQFSADEPYGKAIALVNIKTGLLKVTEEWFVLTGLVLTFILWSTLRSKGYGIFTSSAECQEKTEIKYTSLMHCS